MKETHDSIAAMEYGYRSHMMFVNLVSRQTAIYPALSVPAERVNDRPSPRQRKSAPLVAHNDRNTARLVFFEPRSVSADPGIPIDRKRSLGLRNPAEVVRVNE